MNSDGNCPSNAYKETDDDGNVQTKATPSPNVDELNFSNVGVHAKGMIAGVSYAAEADFQFGKIENYQLADEGDVNPKGWAVFAKLGYMIDPVNIKASFAYGSGDDDLFDDDCKEFQTRQGPDYGMTARLVHYTQIYGADSQNSICTRKTYDNSRWKHHEYWYCQYHVLQPWYGRESAEGSQLVC